MDKQIKRFLGYVRKTKRCWFWQGYKDKHGYGQFRYMEKNSTAHRAAYLMFRGDISAGLHIDHLCRTPSCVNPKHMEAVTPGENALRGYGAPAKNKRKKKCVRGHEFSAENTRALKNGRRECLQCCKIKYTKRNKKEREKEIIKRLAAGLHIQPPRGFVTHCKRGHEFTPSNTKIGCKGERRCLACAKIYRKAAWAKFAATKTATPARTHCRKGHDVATTPQWKSFNKKFQKTYMRCSLCMKETAKNVAKRKKQLHLRPGS